MVDEIKHLACKRLDKYRTYNSIDEIVAALEEIYWTKKLIDKYKKQYYFKSAFKSRFHK